MLNNKYRKALFPVAKLPAGALDSLFGDQYFCYYFGRQLAGVYRRSYPFEEESLWIMAGFTEDDFKHNGNIARYIRDCPKGDLFIFEETS